MTKHYTSLTVTYKSMPDRLFEHRLGKLLGRTSDGSGYCFVDGARDLSWSWEDNQQRKRAERAMKKVRAFIKKLHRRVKVSVEHGEY